MIPPSGHLLQWILRIINSLQNERFYGKLTLEFKEGRVCLLRKEETIKPPTSRD